MRAPFCVSVGIDVLRQILNLETVNRGGIRLGVVAGMSLAIANVKASPPVTQHAYVGNYGNNTVAVIDTATQTVINTVPVGSYPRGVAVAPDGQYAYVTNANDNSVSVVDTGTETVVKTIPAGSYPEGVAVTPDGVSVYAVNLGGTVSVISTKTQTLSNTISVGSELSALGNFIGPNMVVGVLGVDSEATLTQSGFGQWVTLTGASCKRSPA